MKRQHLFNIVESRNRCVSIEIVTQRECRARQAAMRVAQHYAGFKRITDA